MVFCTSDASTIAEAPLSPFTAQHRNLGPSDIEMIRSARIEVAYGGMLESDVKYRFVIDMASLTKAA